VNVSAIIAGVAVPIIYDEAAQKMTLNFTIPIGTTTTNIYYAYTGGPPPK
jgi:hypothetical protein